MITMSTTSEPETHDPFVLDYRRARAALILHLAAVSGLCCQHYLHANRIGYPEIIDVEACPRTDHEFAKLRDFLEGLRENNLLTYLGDVRPWSLTQAERGWLADYGLCEPVNRQTAIQEVDGGEK